MLVLAFVKGLGCFSIGLTMACEPWAVSCDLYFVSAESYHEV